MAGEPQRRDKAFSTRAVQVNTPAAISQEPSSVPLYQNSTWRFERIEHWGDVLEGSRPGYIYGRGYQNPTVEAFERLMADLEGTEAAFAFDSGMAAIHAVVTALAATGQHIVASQDLYGGTHSLFSRVLPRYGIGTAFVDMGDLQAVANALHGSQLLFVETVANPLLKVADLPKLASLCRRAGVPSVIDNTFASPWGCNPAAIGFDYVVHSATKYIGGHDDLIGGVVCSSIEGRERLRAVATEIGGGMQPFEAWLCMRGLATLELRMQRTSASAMTLSELLAGSDKVAIVRYPGLPQDPSHQRAVDLLRCFGGMLSFEHANGLEGATSFCNALELIWVAGSLGGSRSLVAHPASTTHRQVDPRSRKASGIGDGLVRISVGLEDPDDLCRDATQALEKSI